MSKPKKSERYIALGKIVESRVSRLNRTESKAFLPGTSLQEVFDWYNKFESFFCSLGEITICPERRKKDRRENENGEKD